MLETVSQRFQGSCLMLMQQSGENISFLGSGFLVHPDGYLLTTARTVREGGDLEVVAPEIDEGFAPATREKVSPIPVEVVSRDVEHDVALLKLRPELDINMPEAILGSGESDPRGALLMSLGAPFGYYKIHNIFATQAILSGRILSRSGTKLIIFDRRIQYGDIGGPLVSLNHGQVIGVLGGVFDPVELDGQEQPDGVHPINSDLSYATSIEYGAHLLSQEIEA